MRLMTDVMCSKTNGESSVLLVHMSRDAGDYDDPKDSYAQKFSVVQRAA